MPLTSSDRRDYDAFSELLSMVGPYLPLGFIIAVFQHLCSRQSGDYDEFFLLNAIRLTRQLSAKQDLSQHELSMAYAIVFLMENGHSYSDEFPYEVSVGMAHVFLQTHAFGFFNADERQFISRNCRPVYPRSMKISDRARIQILVHNVRNLTDVVYSNPAKLVTAFVKLNKTGALPDNEEPVVITQWIDDLADLFTARYGYKGTIWDVVSQSAKEVFAEEIHRFHVVAENKELIKNLIHQNAKHIFA